RALLGLAELYMNEGQSLVLEAIDCLERLQADLSAIEVDWPDESGESRRTRVAGAVGRLWELVDAKLAADHRAALDPGPFSLTEESAWSALLDSGPPRLLDVRGKRPEALAERLIVIADGDALRCYGIGDGALEWEAELRMSAEFLLDEIAGSSDAELSPPRRYATTDGQTVLINSAQGLHAVGMITGKRLWAIRLDARRGSPDDPYGQELVWARQGRIACVPRRGWLAVVSARDGSTLWERPVGQARTGAVRIFDSFVLAVDEEVRSVQVFDLSDGTLRSRLSFQPVELWAGDLELFYGDGLICGPDGSAVVAYELATGRERWRLPVPEGLAGVFQVSQDLLGVGAVGGQLRLVEIATGEVVFEQQVASSGDGVIDGTLDSGTLVVVGLVDASAAQCELVGIDVTAKAVRWKRADLATSWRPVWFFERARGVLPALVELAEESDGGPVPSGPRLGLAMIDVVSGHDLGLVLLPDGGVAGERLSGYVEVWPGCLVVGTSDRIVGLRTQPWPVPGEETVP
ncbi:MAG: outer membrane protein assembly factor BamB family protein, partial [Planctomycetota bacterium]